MSTVGVWLETPVITLAIYSWRTFDFSGGLLGMLKTFPLAGERPGRGKIDEPCWKAAAQRHVLYISRFSPEFIRSSIPLVVFINLLARDSTPRLCVKLPKAERPKRNLCLFDTFCTSAFHARVSWIINGYEFCRVRTSENRRAYFFLSRLSSISFHLENRSFDLLVFGRRNVA